MIRTIQDLDKHLVILEAVKSYNNTVHSTTGLRPYKNGKTKKQKERTDFQN